MSEKVEKCPRCGKVMKTSKLRVLPEMKMFWCPVCNPEMKDRVTR